MFPLIALLAAAVGADDRVPLEIESGNLKITYPRGWNKIKQPNELFQAAIARNACAILISATETNSTREEMNATYETEQKLHAEYMKVLRRQEIAVAGEKATVVELEAREEGIVRLILFTTFTHQGIAYRFVGVRTLGKIKEFKEDYYSVLDSVEFLKDRKEWLAKYEGKPARTALLGGQASFELNRPRWTENTFEAQKDFDYHDAVHYKFLAGGAWITVRGRDAERDARAELDDLAQELARPLAKATVTHPVVVGPRGKIASVEVASNDESEPRLLRGAVFLHKDLAIQVFLECLGSQTEATQRDWLQLIKGLQLRAVEEPGLPPGFAMQRSRPRQTPNPSLAVFLSKAKRLLPNASGSQVQALSADGTRALLQEAQGFAVATFGVARREAIPATLHFGQPAAWSRDGKKIAYGTPGEVVVVGLDGKDPKRFPGGAAHLAFGASPDELFICTQEQDGLAPVASRYFVSRLEQLDLKSGKRQIVVDFPLGRVTLPVISPDGKQLALVSNRDHPRTARSGGHIYVGGVDGKNMRQLTRDPEEVRSLDWSPDGKWLIAVRRLLPTGGVDLGTGGSGDLYRISLQTGKIDNLTRSGHIDRAWSRGVQIILALMPWDAPDSQNGLFSINAEQLANATSSRPIPALIEPATLIRDVASRVETALGSKAVEDLILTPLMMEKAAKAFADAAAPACDRRLDFSASSLNRLNAVAWLLRSAPRREPAAFLGMGSYYGETLRKCAGAEWRLQATRFGARSPIAEVPGNALVGVVYPFAIGAGRGNSDDDEPLFWTEAMLQSTRGQKLLLVHPPGHALEAVRQATGDEFVRAMRHLDDGEVQAALDLLTREMIRQPRNAALAREIFSICAAVRRPELAANLAAKVVEVGNEIPEWMLLHADALAKRDANRALSLYRKVVQVEYPPADAYWKLGRHYATLGHEPLAEACYRRAYRQGNAIQKRQIRKLLGMEESSEADADE